MKERFEQLMIRCLLVVLPTLLIGVVTLQYLNFSYTQLSTPLTAQAL